MRINAYDTTVGKFLRSSQEVNELIKTLLMTNSLTPAKKTNVFCITQATPVPFDALAFPVTVVTHTRQTVTVFDERPYRDKQNRVTNPNDLAILRLAAFLQQDCAELKFTPLKSARNMVAKAYSEALTQRVSSRAGLDIIEATTLKCLLAFYVVCLIEQPNTDLVLVGQNVLREIYNTEKEFALAVIEDVPHLDSLESLLNAIRANPILFKLKGLGMKDFIALNSSLIFAALGSQVVGAASEAPCLLTAFVYGAARFRALQKTPLGMTLDPKYNKGILETFLKNIDYTYDLNG